MTITITIRCDNAAFTDYPEGEVARILQLVVGELRGRTLAQIDGLKLRDSNGNTVGKVEISG